jgi:LL-diaminopimelate aminotransferase
MKRNFNLTRLNNNYLFPEVNMRKRQYQMKNPDAHLISLGIGDTTEPITPFITQALTQGAARLGTREGYTGYITDQGDELLRERIAEKLYGNKIKSNEIFISDGAKCDLGRLQILFGNEISIAVQDPAYPVYIDGSLLQGVRKIIHMPCLPENNFFPDLKKIPKIDLIYFCSPNNPTGVTATKEQLEKLVAFAKAKRSIIIFDSAYANYIQDPKTPKSIFEIEGAREVAIEVGSFSKIAGFTGVRLGWTVVPNELCYEDGNQIKLDWNRVHSTIFNGASNIAQYGGRAILEEEGLKEVASLATYYMENTEMIGSALRSSGYEVYGGLNAPYLWVRFEGCRSWDVFQDVLEKTHIITTPGIGFGPAGEGFLRFTAFGNRENISLAAERLKKSSGYIKTCSKSSIE